MKKTKGKLGETHTPSSQKNADRFADFILRDIRAAGMVRAAEKQRGIAGVEFGRHGLGVERTAGVVPRVRAGDQDGGAVARRRGHRGQHEAQQDLGVQDIALLSYGVVVVLCGVVVGVVGSSSTTTNTSPRHRIRAMMVVDLIAMQALLSRARIDLEPDGGGDLGLGDGDVALGADPVLKARGQQGVRHGREQRVQRQLDARGRDAQQADGAPRRRREEPARVAAVRGERRR